MTYTIGQTVTCNCGEISTGTIAKITGSPVGHNIYRFTITDGTRTRIYFEDEISPTNVETRVAS